LTFASLVARYRLTEELQSLETPRSSQAELERMGLIDVEQQGGGELLRAAWSRIINPRHACIEDT